jgi:hypothetical protein
VSGHHTPTRQDYRVWGVTHAEVVTTGGTFGILICESPGLGWAYDESFPSRQAAIDRLNVDHPNLPIR